MSLALWISIIVVGVVIALVIAAGFVPARSPPTAEDIQAETLPYPIMAVPEDDEPHIVHGGGGRGESPHEGGHSH